MTTTTVIFLALVIYGTFHLLYGRRIRSRKKHFDQTVRAHFQSREDKPPQNETAV